MTEWISLMKGRINLYVEYGYTHTGNLFADNICLKTSPRMELILDLNHNLRKRNKNSNTYIDAREMERGEIHNLKLVQISDNHILERLSDTIRSMAEIPEEWYLRIKLNGEYTFVIEHKFKDNALGRPQCLHIKISREEN